MSSSLFRSLPHPFQELPGIGCALLSFQFSVPSLPSDGISKTIPTTQEPAASLRSYGELTTDH
jgi:hypothetical protein